MDSKEFQEFDDFVKGTLEELEVPYEAGSWETMYEKWTEAQATEVDQIARDAMVNYQAPYQPTSWEAMHEKWTKVQAVEVDQTVKETLSSYQAPYQPASWDVLLERLENIEYKRRLIALKILEAAVVLLLLITIGRFTSPLIQQSGDSKELQSPERATDQSNEKKSSQAEMALLAPISEDEERVAALAQTSDQRELSTPARSAASTDVKKEPSNHDQRNALIVNENKGATSDLNALSRSNFNTQNVKTDAGTGVVVNRMSDPSTSDDVSVEVIAEEVGPLLSKNQAARSLSSWDLMAARTHTVEYNRNDRIQGESLQIAVDEAAILEFPIVTAPIAAKAIQTRIGLYSQLTRHWGQSNVRPRGSSEKHGQRFDDIGAGFVANVQFGRVGFDMGMGYAKIDFTSSQFHSFGANEAHKVDLPLHLRVNVLQTDKLRIYTKAGVAAHGVLYANYHESLGTTRGGTLSQEGDRFNDGLLKTRVRENNFYMMKSAGIGVDGRMSKNFSIFLEGIYQDNLSGSIGGLLTRDQLQMETVSILLGVLYNLD